MKFYTTDGLYAMLLEMTGAKIRVIEKKLKTRRWYERKKVILVNLGKIQNI